VAALDGAAANLLNYANSHRGFAAQSELWLNPPIILAHREGAVELSHVNERIAEIPWAFRALGDVPPGARILDFGPRRTRSRCPWRPWATRSPRSTCASTPSSIPTSPGSPRPLEEWEAEPASFDVVMCVSTLEHVGLDWYGKQRGGESADREALARLRELLRPEGLLVLTVPYGRAEVDSLQRRYDRAGLDALLEGWTVEQRMVIEQKDDRTWVPVEDSTGHAAAMLVLRPRQD
jgi:SAM-dependent methyltransferase